MKNENGQVMYLVRGIIEDEPYCKLMTAHEIFDLMDLDDCYSIHVEIYNLEDLSVPPKLCKFKGCWHAGRADPLRMAIECDGVEIEVGYGTDH